MNMHVTGLMLQMVDFLCFHKFHCISFFVDCVSNHNFVHNQCFTSTEGITKAKHTCEHGSIGRRLGIVMHTMVHITLLLASRKSMTEKKLPTVLKEVITKIKRLKKNDLKLT